MSEITGQSKSEAPGVPTRARQGAEIQGRDWSWVEATVWSERMLNGVAKMMAEQFFKKVETFV